MKNGRVGLYRSRVIKKNCEGRKKEIINIITLKFDKKEKNILQNIYRTIGVSRSKPKKKQVHVTWTRVNTSFYVNNNYSENACYTRSFFPSVHDTVMTGWSVYKLCKIFYTQNIILFHHNIYDNLSSIKLFADTTSTAVFLRIFQIESLKYSI